MMMKKSSWENLLLLKTQARLEIEESVPLEEAGTEFELAPVVGTVDGWLEKVAAGTEFELAPVVGVVDGWLEKVAAGNSVALAAVDTLETDTVPQIQSRAVVGRVHAAAVVVPVAQAEVYTSATDPAPAQVESNPSTDVALVGPQTLHFDCD